MLGREASRIPRRVLFLLFLVVLGCSGIGRASASDRQGWSVDLKKYGYQEWKYKTGVADASDVQLAVAGNSVGIAVANPTSPTADDPVAAQRAKWNISLLIFDAATGTRLSKLGPWFGDRPFQLFSTSSGKFVLHLRHYNEANVGETLVLVSPDSGEIKQLALPPSIIGPKPMWNYLLVSSTGRTLLVRQSLGEGVHYKLLETDTLRVFSEWTAHDGYALWTLGLSDAQLLAISRSWDGRRTRRALYVRTFGGDWQPLDASFEMGRRFFLLPSLTLNQFAFISDNTIVGISGDYGDPDAHIDVLQTDGSRVSSPVLPWLEPNTSLAGPVIASQDGRYFAVGFSHRTWISHLLIDVWKLDDTPAADEVVMVVWASGEPNAVAKFNLGDELQLGGLSLLSGNTPALVYLRKNQLKVLPIQVAKTKLALAAQ